MTRTAVCQLNKEMNHPISTDPRPEPPERPDDSECCQSGCDPCIFDWYYQEMDRYREELKAWEERHPEGKSGAR
jgi:hypothetical protein